MGLSTFSFLSLRVIFHFHHKGRKSRLAFFVCCMGGCWLPGGGGQVVPINPQHYSHSFKVASAI